MNKEKLEITPKLTIHKLLEAYPELEDVLIDIAPPFKKLKNPFLRKSVAKVATIRHASSVAGLPLDELVRKLRVAVGQELSSESYSDENYFEEEPDWFSTDKIAATINESDVGSKDKMTIAYVLEAARALEKDSIIELVTGFMPAPGIDIMKSKGYLTWSKREENGFIKTYFLKKSHMECPSQSATGQSN